jgi:excisionase family DNA binding protein
MDKPLFSSDRSYRPDEIAAKLSIHICTVYRMVANIADPLPAYRIGGVLRIEGHELCKYLTAHRVKPEEE